MRKPPLVKPWFKRRELSIYPSADQREALMLRFCLFTLETGFGRIASVAHADHREARRPPLPIRNRRLALLPFALL